MIRAVLDANVILSGLAGFQTSALAPAAIVRLWSPTTFELITSDETISEVARALDDSYFAERVGPDLRASFLRSLREEAIDVAMTNQVTGIATHPEDDLILATAVSGQADYLVTGDKQLLLLREVGGIDIVSPRSFLDVLELHPG